MYVCVSVRAHTYTSCVYVSACVRVHVRTQYNIINSLADFALCAFVGRVDVGGNAAQLATVRVQELMYSHFKRPTHTHAHIRPQLPLPLPGCLLSVPIRKREMLSPLASATPPSLKNQHTTQNVVSRARRDVVAVVVVVGGGLIIVDVYQN